MPDLQLVQNQNAGMYDGDKSHSKMHTATSYFAAHNSQTDGLGLFGVLGHNFRGSVRLKLAKGRIAVLCCSLGNYNYAAILSLPWRKKQHFNKNLFVRLKHYMYSNYKNAAFGCQIGLTRCGGEGKKNGIY